MLNKTEAFSNATVRWLLGTPVKESYLKLKKQNWLKAGWCQPADKSIKIYISWARLQDSRHKLIDIKPAMLWYHRKHLQLITTKITDLQAEIVETTFVVSCFSDIRKVMTLFLVISKRNHQERRSYSVVSARNERTRLFHRSSICSIRLA